MLLIEKVNIHDGEEIIEVRRQAYTDEDIRVYCGEIFYREYVGNSDFFSWCLDRYPFYKVLLDKKIIGTFWLDNQTDDRDNHFELQDLCILPQYQNKGYGKKTMELMEEMHPEIKIWTLGTGVRSIRSQHLYEEMGYKRVTQSEVSIHYEKIK